ncbi:MAG: hypothetical protein ACI8W9_000686, partial [Psychromonas sp.]
SSDVIEHTLGLFNLIKMPFPVMLLTYLLLLDVLIHGQHVMMHTILFFGGYIESIIGA